MRHGRRVRWVLGSLFGLVALVSTTGSGGCGRGGSSVASEQSIVVQVVDTAESRVGGVEVTAWIVDVDSAERTPIVVGTAMTDAEGLVEFSYTAEHQPYVCGLLVRDPASEAVLARSPAAVSNHLSDASGTARVALPVSGG